METNIVRRMEVFNALNLVIAVLVTFFLFATNASAAVDQTPWTSLLGSAGDDYADDVVVDAAGNSYVTGYTTDSLGGVFQGGIADMFVAKFDPAGNVLWVRQEGTTEFDRATRITLDDAGNVYLTGYTRGSLAGTNPDTFFDYFIIKYDQDGNRLWGNQYGGVNGQYGFGIAVAPSGDIYACGQQYHLTTTGFPTYYAFITKYDSTGTESWTDVFGADSTTTNQPPEYCTDVAVGSDGYIYMTGAASDCLTATCLGGGDIFVAKYDSVGNRNWLMETGTTGWDIPGKIAVDAAGNSYVTGSTSDTLSGLTDDLSDMITVKVNTNGVSQWVRRIGTASLEQGYGVAVDSNGIVYVAGTYDAGPEIALVKYDSNGVQLSLDTMASGNGDYPAAISVDSAGTNYYIAGDTGGNLDGQTNTGGEDVFVTHNNPTPVPVAVDVTVPDVVGLAEAAAVAAIEDVGLVASETFENSDTVAAGDVISQTPAGGTVIAEGSTVNLVVSLGPVPPPALIEVPDVVGATYNSATATIEAAGLTVGNVTTVRTRRSCGIVRSQSPTGGTDVAPGTAIDLVVTRTRFCNPL
jgi:hypothetical protein